MKRIVVLFIAIISSNFFAQSSLYIPLDMQTAYEKGTRNYDGTPGKNYWLNHTDYKINVELIPDSSMLTGSADIIYYNESPDSLDKIVMRLYQNILKAGSVRDWVVSPSRLFNGMKINSLKINGTDIQINSAQAHIRGTILILPLSEKLAPHSDIKISVNWKFKILSPAIRMGNYKGDFFVAYWYPQVSVYDDVFGWDMTQYSGTVEFYNDFNNYDITYTVPSDYIIWSTGVLQNGKSVFQKKIIDRIEKAKTSDEIIHLITLDDYKNNSVLITNIGAKRKWHYIATKVPDVAWAVSNNYNWDAGSVEVERGRRVLTSAIYPDSLEQNKNAALYARESIRYLSEISPGIPYPWPQTTAFTNKGRSGGMEFPMMQNNGAPKSVASSLGLIFHEITHNYFPFYMGTNERFAAWMDEGWASFFPRRLVEKYDTTAHYQAGRVKAYENMAGKIKDMPMILPSYMLTHGEHRNTFYNRPEVAYEELRVLLGNDLFHKALKEYINRWHEKHPIAYDFFFTFNEVVKEDLSWFWKPWFFEFGYPDLALTNVEVDKSDAVITVKKTGNIPTRITLKLTYENGTTEEITKSARFWKNNDSIKITLPIKGKLTSVVLGNELVPDINKKNNVFEVK